MEGLGVWVLARDNETLKNKNMGTCETRKLRLIFMAPST